MQLIQLSDPAAVDIKKTMSTLENTLDTSQMNGALTDIEQDCATNKISLNKNDVISKPVEEETQFSDKIAQIVEKVKDLNGIVKTNGDTKKKYEQDNDKKEEKEHCNESIDNGSSKSENNGSSALSIPCSPIDKSTDIVSSVVINKNFEEKNVNVLELDVAAQEKKDVTTDDLKVTHNLLNSKDLIDDVSIENYGKVTDTEKLKDNEVSVQNEERLRDVSVFLPNSDTNETDVNISAQLQQLEDDTSMDDAENPSKNDKPASLIKNEENEIKAPTIEQKENNGVDKVEEHEKKDRSDKQSHNKNTQMNEVSEITAEKQPAETIEEKLEDNADTPIDDSTQKNPENVEAFDIAIERQLLEDEQYDSNSDIIMDDIKTVSTENTLDNSNNAQNVAEKIPSVQKYIKVRNFTDMVDQIAFDNKKGENSEDADISVVKPLTEKIDTKEEITDADTTDDVSLITTEVNNVLNNASDKLPIIQKDTEIENIVAITDMEMTKDIAEENQSETPIIDETQITTIKKTGNDDVVMEVDDADLVSEITKDIAEENQSETPIIEETQMTTIKKTGNDDVVMEVDDADLDSEIEKTLPDTTIINIKAQHKTDVKETTKQDKVVNNINKRDVNINHNKLVDSAIKHNEASDVISIDDNVKDSAIKEYKRYTSEAKNLDKIDIQVQVSEKKNEKLPVVCKLSNTMDILSDDEDDPPSEKPSEEKENIDLKKGEQDNKCINLDDDDDIMFIEDTNSQDTDDNKQPNQKTEVAECQTNITDAKINPDTAAKEENSTLNEEDSTKIIEKDSDVSTSIETASQPNVEETKAEPTEIKETKPPLITKTFLKTVTKNLADMTRDELEDFCILKLVESVVDKSNLNEIKIKMKNMSETLEELKKKSLALSKQNRDLQVVVKTVQEDQKKRTTAPLMPMKITRSVGMQVVLSSAEKSILKKKLTTPLPPPVTPARPVRNAPSPKTQKPTVNNIPVPRLVPASSPTIKSTAAPASATKTAPRNTTPQRPEKRPLSKASPSSVTVDLTDDEPPTKMNVKNPTPPVRLVPSQNLMPTKSRPQFGPTGSPRKVYIPISSNNPNIRPPPAVIKNFIPTARPRQPGVVRMQTVRMSQAPSSSRHPAPLPDAMKQYQPPTWKALPPAPDLKLSKVDNGIVISWKFEGYQPDTYEEVASFQLYAYQETPAPPSTALWKKIGDIKALPLPMACTLTQFMSGFKYYFAVRAIDVRSRIGPFSLPGSIMLISKS